MDKNNSKFTVVLFLFCYVCMSSKIPKGEPEQQFCSIESRRGSIFANYWTVFPHVSHPTVYNNDIRFVVEDLMARISGQGALRIWELHLS